MIFRPSRRLHNDAGGHGHAHHHDEPHETPVFSDPAAQSLSQALQSGFNVLRLIMIVLLVAYFLSGYFQVMPGQQGLIVRFGKLRVNPNPVEGLAASVFGPGWHFKWPDPFDTKILIDGRQQSLVVQSFMYDLATADPAKSVSENVPQKMQLIPGADGAMLTGDRNLSHGRWTVEWRVENAEKFVRNVGESEREGEPLLRRVIENAVVRCVAGRRVEEVLREAPEAVREDVRLRVEKELAALDTGILIVKVRSETTEPGTVVAAFKEATSAVQEKARAVQEAEQEADRILAAAAGPRAKYEALINAINAYGAAQTAGADDAKLRELRLRIDEHLAGADGAVRTQLSAAEATRDAAREKLQQELTEFLAFRDLHARDPQIATLQGWSRLREAILGAIENEVFYLPRADLIDIFVNRDPQRILEQERRRIQKQAGL